MQGFAVSGRAGTFLHLPRQLIPQQIQPGLAYRLPPGPFCRHLVNQALELFQQFRTPAQNPKPGCAQRREFFQHPQILRTHHQIQKVDGISLIKLRQYAGLTPMAPRRAGYRDSRLGIGAVRAVSRKRSPHPNGCAPRKACRDVSFSNGNIPRTAPATKSGAASSRTSFGPRSSIRQPRAVCTRTSMWNPASPITIGCAVVMAGGR